MATFDAIVLGTGGVGGASLWHLARRGSNVLGLDRFAPPHDLGSSHGQSRIIRQAYFEHADYTPLLLESYLLWSELADHVARRLYYRVGGAPNRFRAKGKSCPECCGPPKRMACMSSSYRHLRSSGAGLPCASPRD